LHAYLQAYQLREYWANIDDDERLALLNAYQRQSAFETKVWMDEHQYLSLVATVEAKRLGLFKSKQRLQIAKLHLAETFDKIRQRRGNGNIQPT
jgi:hypothetical protein